MLRPWCWFAASLALLGGTAPAGAATLLLRQVTATIHADGRVQEQVRMRVRIDGTADAEEWSDHVVYLDENRKLDSLEVRVQSAGKAEPSAKGVSYDWMEVPASYEVHSSARYRVASLPPLGAGDVVFIEQGVTARPYFPAETIALTLGETTERLEVKVQGAAGLRWHLTGTREGLTVEEIAGGLRISAQGLPAEAQTAGAPAEVSEGPVLHYAWGSARDWDGVGRWYRELAASVPLAEPPVTAQAVTVVGAATGRREKALALTRFVRDGVRYVAVEVGIGGYRPYSPRQTLEQKWGDCKGKSYLLIDLLRAVGISAWPVLVRAATDSTTPDAFASPIGFNHMIVAIEAEGVAAPGEPVAEGLLFVDPTLDHGELAWLHPSVKGQPALVVKGEGSRLVRIPLDPQAESQRLRLALSVAEDRAARGGAGVEIRGADASQILSLALSAPPERLDAALRGAFLALLPGATVGTVSWSALDGAIPAISLSASVTLPQLLAPDGSGFSFLLPASGAFPEPKDLEGRTLPILLEPGVREVLWSLNLPAGPCSVSAEPVEIGNALGSFRQTVNVNDEGRLVRVTRRTEVLARRAEVADLTALKELALTERRTAKRRIRVACAQP
ncbi:MAG TPA: transglutaminase domain-containing protein [Thermoanaerobaculia bacterium]|nr:transglutaminase domain-containing protein [Thermoanaerobaculia bacterium]